MFLSPPHLQDDVDAVQATIARNIIASGDWVTPHLNGVPYLEKPPLKYWAIAVSYLIFGQHDWSARLPLMLSVIALCWVTMRFTTLGPTAKKKVSTQGLCLRPALAFTSFTRILIVEAMLTLGITAALWAMLRALRSEETRPTLGVPQRYSDGLRSPAQGIDRGRVSPVGIGVVYLLITHQFFREQLGAACTQSPER